MNINELVLNFGGKLENLIARYEEYKELNGEQKKARVVEQIGKWFEDAMDVVPINPLLKFIIKKAIIAVLPSIVQVAFDLIQSRIKGITK